MTTIDDYLLLNIVITAEEYPSADELRATYSNITSLVAILDPQFQIDGEITQINATAAYPLVSCTLRNTSTRWSTFAGHE